MSRTLGDVASFEAPFKLSDAAYDSHATQRSSFSRRSSVLSVVFAILAGIALRAVFIRFFPGMDDDSLAYGSIANNLLAHHGYAIGNPPEATLIRLPGYPLFLALVFGCFGTDNYAAVRWIQLIADLGGCLLISSFVRESISDRAGLIALWVAALCPFTANYVAIPMTETLSVFCVSLALWSTARLIGSMRGFDENLLPHVLLTAMALCGAILLRPDGVLLAAAVLLGLVYHARREDLHDLVSAVAYIVLLIVAVLTPWTARNYLRFHVFQPLAPRYANNPDELVPYGVLSWNQTWELDYVSSPEVFWNMGASPVDMNDLPTRTFDSPEQHAKTSALVHDYNSTCNSSGEDCRISDEIDHRFGELATERYERHPYRTGLLLPMLRVLDMWFRPRIEYLPVPLHWWEWRSHVRASLFATAYLALNGAIVLLAVLAFARGTMPLAWAGVTYIVLRCLLLATLSNAEPRYTLECYPILIAGAAISAARFSRVAA